MQAQACQEASVIQEQGEWGAQGTATGCERSEESGDDSRDWRFNSVAECVLME